MTKVIIYCRVASHENGNLEAQELEMLDYARKKGWSVLSVVTDIGSGLTLDRPGIHKLKKAVAKDNPDYVLVKCASRISRNVSDMQNLVSKIEKLGSKVLVAQMEQAFVPLLDALGARMNELR